MYSAAVKTVSDETFPRATLVEPTKSGFIVIAAEVDRRPPFLLASHKKRQLLRDLQQQCQKIEHRSDVIGAVTFRALLIPPGRGVYLRKRPDVHVARFDVVVLIETVTAEAAETLRKSEAVSSLESQVRSVARHTRICLAQNVKRLGPVCHSSNGVFLFNFFVADDVDQNIAIWEYTAGWFQQETGLNNSTVLLPDRKNKFEYSIINHCRWDRLRDVLPSLLFKGSFRSYVLANFEANRVAAIPILYRLA